MKKILTAGILCAALFLSACSGSKSDSENAGTSAEQEKTAETGSSAKTESDPEASVNESEPDGSWTTSTDSITGYTVDELKGVVSEYPLLSTYGMDAFSDEPDDGTYVIPGLIQTATLEDGKESVCDEMVPQGVAVTDQYVIISAYCKKHIHNSVLYIMDKDSHEYLKTVIIDGKFHEGGIAWNESTDYLWVATRKDQTAAASSLKMSEIESYDENSGKPIKFHKTITTDTLSEDSFMTVHGDELYLGTFTLDGQSKVEAFDISDPGNIDSTPEKEIPISDWCQGIAFCQDYVLLSDSDEHSQSHLRVFKADDSALYNGDEIKDFTLPERLEQIAIDGDHAYIIFESAASAYSEEDVTKIGRIIQVNLKEAGL